MRAVPPRGDDRRVTLSDGEILISVDAGSPAIAGTVWVAGEPARPFEGWLGLLSALRSATEAVTSAGSDRSARTPPQP
jgi:hypothetical protein